MHTTPSVNILIMNTRALVMGQNQCRDVALIAATCRVIFSENVAICNNSLVVYVDIAYSTTIFIILMNMLLECESDINQQSPLTPINYN